jgi:hypothetical protein
VIAALYVATNGCYFGLPDVDPWDEKRDARLYAGPHPVVAHPPCERWGRHWSGGPSAKVRRAKGDDGGCFAAALAAVRRWGGVLEHPADSHAWRAFGLIAPPRSGGWVASGDFLGWTCCVEQGHYGHRARKATWLYVCSARARAPDLPSLFWGPSRAVRKATTVRAGACAMMCKAERSRTPLPFRDLLLDLSRRCGGDEAPRACDSTRDSTAPRSA